MRARFPLHPVYPSVGGTGELIKVSQALILSMLREASVRDRYFGVVFVSALLSWPTVRSVSGRSQAVSGLEACHPNALDRSVLHRRERGRVNPFSRNSERLAS